MARELISDGVQLNASAGIGAGQALRTRAANKGCEQKLRAKRDSRLALRMLNAHRDGKMRTTCATRTKKRRLRFRKAAFSYSNIDRGEFLVLGRPGSDLLSQGLSHSTIGAEEFNGRVRDGIGFMLLARTTRPAKDKDTKQAVDHHCA